MAPPVLTPPDARPPWSGGDDRRPPPPPPPPAGRGGGPRGRRPLAALLVTSAFLGGGASVAILAATGALSEERPAATTVVTRTVATSGTASAGGLDARAVYGAVAPGVVDITAKGVTSGRQSSSPFGAPQDPSQTTATGTGFVADRRGHIVTASHVVDGASAVTVTFQDGTTRRATVVGQDDATDVAVLKVATAGLTLHPLTLGRSASLQTGAGLAVIGDPFGYQRSISTGIVSGVDRSIEAPNGFTVSHAIQTDAAMNPGNSGGPVVDASGRVVGIADQIATGGGADQSAGVGFAVPIDVVRSVLPELEAGRTVRHAYLGVATADDGASAAGATVASVTSGSPAAGAGLRQGDVITRIDGTRVTGSGDVVSAIAAHRPGDEVAVTVRRGAGTRTLTVTLGTQPANASSGG